MCDFNLISWGGMPKRKKSRLRGQNAWFQNITKHTFWVLGWLMHLLGYKKPNQMGTQFYTCIVDFNLENLMLLGIYVFGSSCIILKHICTLHNFN